MSAKVAAARSEERRIARNKIQQEELDEVLADYTEKPLATPKVQPRARQWCCVSTRRYFGCCYTKTLHEAVLDGDATSITKRLQSAQRKDKKKISRLGGVERAFHGKSSGPGFEGKTAKIANEFDADGRTALSLATKEEREDLVDLLLSLQADPDAGEDGETHGDTLTGASPMMHAVLADLPGTVIKLTKKHADLKLSNSEGMTALMLAALRGDADLVELLLERGADPDSRDKAGWTPLMYASYGGHLACVKIILDTGVSKKKKDKNGYTAKDWAMYVRLKKKSVPHGEVEAYLEKHKAHL